MPLRMWIATAIPLLLMAWMYWKLWKLDQQDEEN